MTDMPVETIEVEARSGRRGSWRLVLRPDSLGLEAAGGGESFEVPRDELPDRLELREIPLGPPLLVVRTPKRVTFTLDREGARRFRAWLGPPTRHDLRVALKRRMGWGLPIGLLFVFTSLPWKGDPQAGVEAIPFDPLSAFLGGSLVAMALAMRVWPNRYLLLADFAWFLLLAIKVLWDIVRGASWLWMILVVFILVAADDGLRQFRRFVPMERP